MQKKYRKPSKTAFLFLLAAWALFMLVVTAPAQTLYGTLTGNVKDATGASIDGAAITATELGTGQSRQVTTNSTGNYEIANIPSGNYQVKIEKEGFSTFQVPSVVVPFNVTTRIDAALKLGARTETVEVSAAAAQLQTDTSNVSATIGSKDFVELPQPTRTYQGLLGQVAGVAPPGYAALGTNNTDRSMTVQANGTSTSATDVRIEGVSAVQPWTPFVSSLTPSVEAIDSVSMVTGSAEADQTLASGAVVNIQLKSGTNKFHGSAYEFHTDNLFKARPFFLAPGRVMPKNIDNDYGGTLGGPIIRNKLFFFVSYEGDALNQGSVQTLTVPTAAQLGGDFTSTGTTLYDPATGNPDGTGKKTFLSETGKNAIPANRISANVKPLLALYTNYPATTATTSNNFTANLITPQRLQKLDTKFDWDATSKLRIVGRYNYHPYSINLAPNTFASIFNLTASSAYGQTNAATVAATYTATPHFVLSGSFGFTRSNQYLVPPYDNQKYGADTLGISGVNIAPLPFGGGIPQFVISGYTTLGYNYPYLTYNDPVFGYAANGTWNRGRHTLKFGVTINRIDLNHVETSSDRLTFSGNATALNGGTGKNQFNSFGDFLLGNPSAWQNSFQPYGGSDMRMNQYSLYISDTAQISPKFTATYGTGWQYFPIPSRSNRGLQNFNLSTNQYEICGYAGIPSNCGISTSKLLFSPHVGFAFRPADSYVIRGGFSIATEQFNMARDILYNYPENIGYSATALNPFVPVGSLSTGVPTITAPSVTQGVITIPAGISFYALPQHLKRGYTESFNLAIQKQWHSLVMQAAYVGNVSVDQHQRYNINGGTVGGGVASQALYKFNGTTAAEYAILGIGHTNYNSLQVTVRKTMSHGFQIGSTYTYSKWLGLCCDTNGFGNLNTPIPQYRNSNYVAMPGDITHLFNINGIVESPFGKNKKLLANNAIAGAVLGGWQLNMVATMFTGTPFTVTADGSSLNAPGSVQRADLVKPKVKINGGTQQYFDTTAFRPVSAVRFGTSSYNMLRAPGAANLDASIFRSFTLPEHLTLQLRLESFNVTNTPHFGTPGSNASSATYDSNGNITNANGFGQITGVNPISRPVDERNFRLGAKLIF